MNTRLAAALAAYAVLIGCSIFLLHGIVLKAVLILFAGLIARTLISIKLHH
ncbi:MAG TPA: hypothetical protein VKB79_11915 [Bryobacteraceae bacterium]|nr:hypothetical protein [Bryobacteraceae bacterium]